MITEPPIIRSCSEGAGMWYRTSVEVGDIVLKPGVRWLITSPEDIQFYYDEVGIELWGFPSTWEDVPRKPKVQFTADPAYKYAYGTIVRMLGHEDHDDQVLRYLGGDWWEIIS